MSDVESTGLAAAENMFAEEGVIDVGSDAQLEPDEAMHFEAKEDAAVEKDLASVDTSGGVEEPEEEDVDEDEEEGLEEEPVQEAKEVEEPEEQVAPQESRAQTRIRELNAAKNEAQAQTAQAQYQYQMQHQQMQHQMELQKQQFELQQQQLTERLSGFERDGEAQRLEALSPVERLKYEAKTAALDEARKEFSAELAVRDEKLNGFEQMLQQRDTDERKRVTRQQIYQEVAKARTDLIGDIDPEYAEALGPGLDNLILTAAAAGDGNVEAAKQEVLRVLNGFMQGKRKANGSRKAGKLRKSQLAPRSTKAVPNQPPQGAGRKNDPTHGEIVGAGYGDFWEWDDAGRPSL
jgi:hypothetical protein